MTVREDILALRREMRKLAGRSDPGLIRRYALWHPPGQRRTLYRRLRKALGRRLRELGLRPTPPEEPWRPGLSLAETDDGARAVVIWALGADRDRLRDACGRLAKLLAERPDRAPVMITDVADFAFYSRLGWLVEYLPSLSEPAGDYGRRKQCYLAWRYREAPALPWTLGLHGGMEIEDLMID